MADSEKVEAAENNGSTKKDASAAASARSAMKDAADAWRNLGKQMRDEFRAGAKDATARAMDMAGEFAERTNESTHGASTRINDAAVQAMNAAGEAMDKAYDAVNEAADKAYQAASEVADASAEAAGKAAGDARDTASQVADAASKSAAAAAETAAKATTDMLEQAQKTAAEWQDKFMRLHAEWDTYRRRTKEDRAKEKELANEKLVKDLLPVLDDFERTIAYANENGVENLLGGVEAVQSKLVNVLESDGLKAIDPKDEAFDALEHQAVGTVENTDVPDETVAQVYQKGYKMGDKVIRPAMVQVSTGGPQRPKDDAEEE